MLFRSRSRRIVTMAAASVGLVAIFALFVLLILIVPALIVDHQAGATGTAALGPIDRLKAENDVRSTLLQGLAGLLALSGVAAGAAMTLRQIRVSREGHTIELFGKAIDQLASDEVSVRHGGIYALEFLAELDPRYAGKIHALLTAFIRQHVPWPSPKTDEEAFTERANQPGRLPDDVGGAIGALRRASMIAEGAWSELEKVDLRYAQLDGYDVPRACFIGSNLTGASLVGANLSGASMSDTILRNASLSGAKLCGADLSGADMEGADIAGVIADSKTRWPPNFQGPTALRPSGG
jgi:hypothetical protein